MPVSFHWNNFLWPLIITNSVEPRPLTVGLQVFSSTDQGIDWSVITAATLMTSGPLLIALPAVPAAFVQASCGPESGEQAGMTLYELKPRFQALLRPLASRLAASGVTANQVTLTAAAGSVALGALLTYFSWARPLFLLLPLWLFIRMALNAIDGMLAREFDQKSRLGAYLNELCDIVSDAALMLPFCFVWPFGAASGRRCDLPRAPIRICGR